MAALPLGGRWEWSAQHYTTILQNEKDPCSKSFPGTLCQSLWQASAGSDSAATWATCGPLILEEACRLDGAYFTNKVSIVNSAKGRSNEWVQVHRSVPGAERELSIKYVSRACQGVKWHPGGLARVASTWDTQPSRQGRPRDA